METRHGKFGNKMNILVTGSDGYIGTVLVSHLLGKGYHVTGLDTGFFRTAHFHNGITKLPHTINKDVRTVIPSDFSSIDTVIHLAELSNDPMGQNDPEITYKINHLGTARLSKMAKKAGVKRFIYFSSCSVYGASDSVRDENSPTNPQTEYAKCKVLNEKAILQLTDEEFSTVIFRNATVFGVSPRMRFDLVVNNLTGLAFIQKEIKMESNGEPWRPLVHIDDLCRAVLSVITVPNEVITGQIFNIGATNSNYQIKEIASLIAGEMPGCKVSLNKNGRDNRNYRVNFDKLNSKIPGFKCESDLKKGIRELFSIYKEIGLKREVFDSPKYTRLKQLRFLQETNQINKDLFWID